MKFNEELIRRFDNEIKCYEKRQSNEIGTLSEKMLHAVLKRTIAGDLGDCEVKIEGKNIADVVVENKIYEIQSESLFPVKRKLDFYLENTDYDVDIIFPVPHMRYTLWIDIESGEITRPKRRPKIHRLSEKVDELSYVAEYLESGRVNITVLYIDEEELRALDGKRSKDKKRGSSRIERRPLRIVSFEELRSRSDFEFLLPPADEFGRRDLMKHNRITSSRKLYALLKIISVLDLAEVVGKEKNAYIYKKKIG